MQSTTSRSLTIHNRSFRRRRRRVCSRTVDNNHDVRTEHAAQSARSRPWRDAVSATAVNNFRPFIYRIILHRSHRTVHQKPFSVYLTQITTTLYSQTKPRTPPPFAPVRIHINKTADVNSVKRSTKGSFSFLFITQSRRHGVRRGKIKSLKL